MALAGLMYCPNCGGVNAPVTRMKGSLVLNLFLTLLLFFPGMLYFVWRLTTRGKVCRACSATGMIPLDSPKARAALAVKA